MSTAVKDKTKGGKTFAKDKAVQRRAVANSHTAAAKAKRKATMVGNRLLEAEVMNTVKQALLDGEKTPLYQVYIDKFLKNAVQNPAGQCGKMLGQTIFNEGMLTKLDQQAEMAMQKELDFLRYRIIKDCFDKQREVIMSPPDVRENVVVCASRRAGKTVGASKLICYVAAQPNTPVLYVGKTFTNAVQQMFDLVVAEAHKAELAISKPSKTEGYIEFANGSVLTFKGNDNVAAADKSRGYHYRLILIDEAAFQCNMSHLVDEVLEPCLTDYKDGRLILLSSPPRVPKTYFEKVWNQKDGNGRYTWKHFAWNMFDNPYLPDPNGSLDHICLEKGVTRDSPLIRREYLGEFVYDTEAQVYKGYQTYQLDDQEMLIQKIHPTDIVIGNDFGFSDYNGIVMLAYNKHTGYGIVLKETKFNHSTVDTIVEVDRQYFNLAQAVLLSLGEDPQRVMIVTDSNEKSITYELNTTYRLPAFTCYKYDKKLAISSMSEAMASGRIIIPINGSVADECEQTVYKRDEQDNILPEIDDQQFHPDITDALLYGYRQMMFDCGDKKIGGVSNDQKKARSAVVSKMTPTQVSDLLRNSDIAHKDDPGMYRNDVEKPKPSAERSPVEKKPTDQNAPSSKTDTLYSKGETENKDDVIWS